MPNGGWACNGGCFVCGPLGQRMNHIGTGCCGSTLCNAPRWEHQVQTWLSTEEKFNITLWLEVEKATVEAWLDAEAEFKRQLAAVPATHVKWVARDPNNPSRARAEAKARRVRERQQ